MPPLNWPLLVMTAILPVFMHVFGHHDTQTRKHGAKTAEVCHNSGRHIGRSDEPHAHTHENLDYFENVSKGIKILAPVQPSDQFICNRVIHCRVLSTLWPNPLPIAHCTFETHLIDVADASCCADLCGPQTNVSSLRVNCYRLAEQTTSQPAAGHFRLGARNVGHLKFHATYNIIRTWSLPRRSGRLPALHVISNK